MDDFLARCFFGRGSSGCAEALKPWLAAVFHGQVESGGDEIDKLVEDVGAFTN